MSTGHEQRPFAAVVLAAGRGQRMGRNKATLPWGPQTLLEAWVRRFVDQGAASVAVVLGADGALVQEQVDPGLPIAWATNEDVDGSGPRESLLLGLDALPADLPAFFTPVDVPVVAADTLRRMLEAWRGADEEPMALLPRIGDRTGHPVLACPALVQRLYEGERGDRIDELLAWSRRVLHVDVDDERVLANMNDPAQYANWAPTGGWEPS